MSVSHVGIAQRMIDTVKSNANRSGYFDCNNYLQNKRQFRSEQYKAVVHTF